MRTTTFRSLPVTAVAVVVLLVAEAVSYSRGVNFPVVQRLLRAALTSIRHSLIATILLIVIGLAVGLGLAWREFVRRLRRHRFRQALRLTPGSRYIRTAFGFWPEFLQISDTDSTMKWLNHTVRVAWPHYNKSANEFVPDYLEPELEAAKPRLVHRIAFSRFNLGENPIEVLDVTYVKGRRVEERGVTHGETRPHQHPATTTTTTTRQEKKANQEVKLGDDHHEKDKEITIDIHLSWKSSADIRLLVQLGRLFPNFSRFEFQVANIVFRGILRIRLAPLINRAPLFGGLVWSFRDPPMISFEPKLLPRLFCGVGASIVTGPIIRWLMDYIVRNIVKYYVYPEQMAVDLSEMQKIEGVDRTLRAQQRWLYQKLEPQPAGIIRVRFVEITLHQTDESPPGRKGQKIKIQAHVSHRFIHESPSVRHVTQRSNTY